MVQAPPAEGHIALHSDNLGDLLGLTGSSANLSKAQQRSASKTEGQPRVGRGMRCTRTRWAGKVLQRAPHSGMGGSD